jgi:exodeoxyribonuclease VII large subunit
LFLAHFDLRGKQERDGLRLNRQIAALGHQARMSMMKRRARLDSLAAQLHSLSPRQILQRGYAIVFDPAGKVLKDAAQVSPGQEITLRLARGKLAAKVGKVSPES